MKRILLLCSLFACVYLAAQPQNFNTTLRDDLDYNVPVNDVWGYAAPDGTEYALVGLGNAVSIVSLANPDSIYELHRIPGMQTTWRDLKTFGEYAYVVSDATTEGLLTVDLALLPDSITYSYDNVPRPDGSLFRSAHNIYIDPETGYAYTAGGNLNSGGMVIFDVGTYGDSVVFVANAPSVYAHDVYVQDGRMYASQIFDGTLGIYDVSDVDNIIAVGERQTPFDFTHNAWTTADANYIFTADERADAPIAAYDISNESDPVLLDEFRPERSLNSGVIPHNVHVLDEYLVVSYYTDGLEIADASVPDNIIEVGYYDTWLGSDGGFNGNWGAYPFLPSTLVLASDRSTGLYVVEVDYVRGARLHGTITDGILGTPLNQVSVEISGPDEQGTATDASGVYRTGSAFAGDYMATFSLEGYSDLVVPVTLENGVITVLDTFLLPDLPRTNLTINVVSSVDGSPIQGADVVLISDFIDYENLSNAGGQVDLPATFNGAYEVFVAKWGYRNEGLDLDLQSETTLTFELDPGYLDGFRLDQGWTASNDAPSGNWVREEPTSNPFAPADDAEGPTDVGEYAFLTGNDGANDVIIDVPVVLTSPIFDGTSMENPVLAFQYWFSNTPNTTSIDSLHVQISNGNETVDLKTYVNGIEGLETGSWTRDSFTLAAFLELTDQMQLTFSAEALNPSFATRFEVGIDDFEIFNSPISNTENISLADLVVTVSPNPSADVFTLQYSLPNEARSSVALTVIDALGRQVIQRQLAGDQRLNQLQFGAELPVGNYFLQLRVDGTLAYAAKLLKQR